MRAMFFDLDGTLVDSSADLASAVNFTRRELGLAPISQSEAMAHVGRGARYLLEHSIPEAAGRFDEVWPMYSAQYKAHMLDTTRLYPYVRETLEELGSRGWLLGINTNKPSFATKAVLEHCGIARYFGSAIVAGGDCEEMKPSAVPLRLCASLMNGHVLSANDWMVGDSWADMDCAFNAGVKGAFCTFGFGELAQSSCTVKINRFDEILSLCK